MPWVRFDDQYPIHMKIGPLSDRLYRLHSEAIFWCARNTTDGVIRADMLAQVRARARKSDADELTRRELFHRAGDPPCDSESCPPAGPDGWVIHDYWAYQPKRSDVDKDRKGKADRQRRWREKRRAGSTSTARERDGPGDALRNGGGDASRNGPGDATPRAYDPRPAPPRPEGGGGGTPPEHPPPDANAPDAPDGGRAPPADPDAVRRYAADARAAIRRRPDPPGARPPGQAFAELADAVAEQPTRGQTRPPADPAASEPPPDAHSASQTPTDHPEPPDA